AFDEVLAAEVGVFGVVGEHVPDRGQDRMLQRDQGAFFAAAGDDASVAGGEVGVLGPRGGYGGLAEGGLEPGVAVPGGAAARAAPGLVVARAYAGPRGQVGCRGEAGDVGAD